MATPKISAKEASLTTVAIHRLHRRNGGREAHQLVELARRHTQSAIRKIVLLMEGKAGTIKTLDKNGVMVEIDIEVPAAVQLKAAEVLVERGWGKAPIAVLLKDDTLLPGQAANTMTVAEKILALSAAQETKDSIVDLEASEQTEVMDLDDMKRAEEATTEEATTEAPGREPELVSAADMI